MLMIARKMPDVVILDIHMPNGSRLDVLWVVKSTKSVSVVVMLTVGPSSEYKEKCLAMGADYFFEKSSVLRKMTALLRKPSKNLTR
jgi:DNA-binding NarL/FixJ family response regulator